MALVAGAMSSLVPKLWEIIKDEYGLQKGVRKEARSLAQELESAHAALRKVAEVPPDLLDEQVRVWARELREASYDMEDVLDAFLVRVDGGGGGEGDQEKEKGSFVRRLREKMASLLSKSKARRGIAGAIDDIKKQLREVAERRGRYTVGDIAVVKPASAPPIDPRLAALYNDAAKLVGIEDAMDELEVCDSIGSGVENNPDMNDMRKIAEDFIQHEKHGDNLFEIGERYFNELINRSMMEPALLDEEGMPQACRVHDIVLDLICSLSREENFVTIPDQVEQSTSWGISVKAHRLSLQKPTNTSTCSQVTTASMSQVRSFTVFSPAIKLPSLSCFQVLRVLDLEDFDLSEDGSLKLRHLGSLLHLRYLGLRGTSYSGELPAEIGQLQFLQTLDIQGTDIQELPSSTAKLTQLKCLCFDYNHRTRLRCSWLKQLTSLEELTTVRVDKDSAAELVEALVHLTHLRVLSIKIAAGHGELDETLSRALAESLGNLHEIRRLEITDFAGADLMKSPPPKLRKLAVSVVQMRSGGRAFSSLPPWLSPSSLPLLSSLHIAASRV
ncbi:hypothetical protein HU200_057296 [Digitaria exilis]|uniref:Rx N-terminal domain-containing protein n=1 Tax=Digitaria exilis TaxID=1010633 RepID=A0A835AFR9_9POAL|nr:hypothetical protein HU200_057296 [Digitaria exilis]